MTAVLAPSRRLLPARRLGTPPPNATLGSRVDLGPTMRVLTVIPDDGPPAFVPGQYLALGLEVDGRILQRPYSAASIAADGALEFAVRLVPDGALTPLLWQLRAGDRLRVGPPKGLFRLADGDRRTHLLLATGTGIAPLAAMAGALRARDDGPRIVVVQGAARADELAFVDRFERWAEESPTLRHAAAVSRPGDPANASWRGPTGRVDALLPGLLAEAGVDPGDAVAYVCGNPDAIESIRRSLLGLGMPSQAIVSEPYWVAPARSAP